MVVGRKDISGPLVFWGRSGQHRCSTEGLRLDVLPFVATPECRGAIGDVVVGTMCSIIIDLGRRVPTGMPCA
jgi:hypothetical protein